MPLSSVTRASARRLLAGERIDVLFPARIPLIPFGAVVVAVTPTSIVVLSTSAWRRSRPTSVFARYPRRTPLGPPDLRGVPTFTLGGRQYEIDEEYVPVLNTVDAELRGDDALPPDPMPWVGDL